MSGIENSGREQIEFTDDGIEVTVTSRFGSTVTGWPEAKEDLGLNRGGPDPVGGVEVVEAVEHYHDEGDEYPYGYGPITLRFANVDALDYASARLYDKATERFEWGDASGGEDVQTFAGQLPTKFDVEQARKSRDLDTGRSQEAGQ